MLHRSVTPGTVIILLLLLDDSNELEIQEEYDAISADSEFQDLLIESGTTLTLTVSVYGRLCGASYFKIFLMLTFASKVHSVLFCFFYSEMRCFDLSEKEYLNISANGKKSWSEL